MGVQVSEEHIAQLPERRCSNCGANDPYYISRGRCRPCYAYWRRHGSERPANLVKSHGVEKLFTPEERVRLRRGVQQQLSVARSNFDGAKRDDPQRPSFYTDVVMLSRILKRL